MYVLQFHASVKMDMYVYCNTGKYNDPCLMDSTSTVVSHLIVRSQMTLLCMHVYYRLSLCLY